MWSTEGLYSEGRFTMCYWLWLVGNGRWNWWCGVGWFSGDCVLLLSMSWTQRCMRCRRAWLFCPFSPVPLSVRFGGCCHYLPQFVIATDSQPWIIFMNIPLPLLLLGQWCVLTLRRWTNCPTCSWGCGNLWSDLSRLMTGWSELWRRRRRGNCCLVITAAQDNPNSRWGCGGGGQSSSTGWVFGGGAVSKCHFRLRWHLGPNCRNSFSSHFLSSAASGVKKKKITVWYQKLFLFSSALLYLPEFSLSGLHV